MLTVWMFTFVDASRGNLYNSTAFLLTDGIARVDPISCMMTDREQASIVNIYTSDSGMRRI